MSKRHEEAARALIQQEIADREALGRPEVTSHAERVYAAMQDDFGPMSAHAVALRAGGWIKQADEAALAALDRAKLLRRRDQLTLPNDPSPIRGKIATCVKWKDVAQMRPSITLPAGFLRSLRFSGPELRQSDVSLFWLLYALWLGGGIRSLSWTKLKSLFGAADKGRLRTSIARLITAKMSITDEPSIPRHRWINCETFFGARQTPEHVEWAFSRGFIREAKVHRGGSRYAHLGIVAVRAFNTLDQERVYRAILAAATECGAWRGPGGSFVWRLSPDQLASLTGLVVPDVKILRRERIMPLAERLSNCADRVRITGLVVGERNATQQGKPATRLDMSVTIEPASENERSKTLRLMEDHIGAGGTALPRHCVYVGSEGETERQKRRRKGAEHQVGTIELSPGPIATIVSRSPEDDEIEAIFEQFLDAHGDDEPELDMDAIMMAFQKASSRSEASPLDKSPTGLLVSPAAPPKMPKPSERHAAEQAIDAKIQAADEECSGEIIEGRAQSWPGSAIFEHVATTDADFDRNAEDAISVDERDEDDERIADFSPQARAELDAEMWSTDSDD